MDLEHIRRALIAVGDRPQNTAQSIVAGVRVDRSGAAALENGESSDHPSSECPFHKPIPAVPEPLSMTER